MWPPVLMKRGKSNHSFFYRNGLSIVLLGLTVIFISLQFYTGWLEHNEERSDDGLTALSAAEYLRSGHFSQVTFENWESEFLQMALYVLLTVSLFQVGSAESKDPDKEEEVDRKPHAYRNSPWPVRKGGVWLKIYSSSLSIAFGILFVVSTLLHFHGSLRDENEKNRIKGKPEVTWTQYLGQPRFWFESFQNWQSEFLAVASIVILSIWLRQKGSPESKPVDASHDQTGE